MEVPKYHQRSLSDRRKIQAPVRQGVSRTAAAQARDKLDEVSLPSHNALWIPQERVLRTTFKLSRDCRGLDVVDEDLSSGAIFCADGRIRC